MTTDILKIKIFTILTFRKVNIDRLSKQCVTLNLILFIICDQIDRALIETG